MMTIDFRGIPIEIAEVLEALKQNMSLVEVCEQILKQKIILQTADSQNITVTPEEIQNEVDEIRRNKHLEKASDTMAWLNEQMITPDEWEIAIQNHVLTKKLAKHLFEEQVEPFFAERRLNFDRFVVYQISLDCQNFVQELFYQIEEEEISFYEAARLHNLDQNARYLCGYTGQKNRLSFPPDIAAVIFQDPLPIGILLGPIQTEDVYHLLRIEEHIPAELTPELRQEILHSLFDEWINKEIEYVINMKG